MKRICFLLLLVALYCFAAQDQRIVAIGDVHGDLTSFRRILESAQLLDTTGNWAGGNAVFVQTGDVLDRGAEGKKSLDLIMKLESEAPQKQGRVISLIGNHEVINLMGDLRYVPPEEFAQLAGLDSEKRLKAAYESYKKWQLDRAERRKLPKPEFSPEMEAQWMKDHPRGFLEHREAYGPNGKYGKWIRKRDAVAEIEGNVFLHGGIAPAVASLPIREINERIRKELALFDKLQKSLIDQKVFLPFFTFNEMIDAAKEEYAIRKPDKTLEAFLGLGGWLSVSPEGPLWFRGYAQWPDEELLAQLPPLLKSYNTKRFVVGHTVTKTGQIQSRQNHAVLMIDTGMNKAFYPTGQASALEIHGSKLTAIYLDQRVPLNP